MSAKHTYDLNPRTDPPLDFRDGPLGELGPGDYATLGFMAGLEVHQQLDTRGKLFCRCPAGINSTRVDGEVLRHMRPTLSELGEYDGTALMEFKTRKEIVYQLDRRSVCTYEIDDTPPFEIDEEAVRISLDVARMFELNLVSELHVMRKQYLDGSIPTGFQRTAMVGLSGEIPFPESELGRGRYLRIRQLSLEEDSCREVSDVGHRIVFRTDRLGVPLTETVTEPELLTPLDARAGVLAIARATRATGKVRRGPGAARQDVNVSVAGGRRVEIKGVCTHRLVPALVHNEAFRQLNLLRIKAELERRGVARERYALAKDGRPWEQGESVVDARSILRSAAHPALRAALERGQMACGVRLPELGGLLHHPTQPGLPFAHELAERARVIACLKAPPLFLDTGSDDGPSGVPPGAWRELRSATRAAAGDALLIVFGEADDVETGVREVLARAGEALDGVPSETRQAHDDGTTGFERILPGPDRMYPDTDTPPVPVSQAWIQELDRNARERPWQRSARYARAGLDEAAAWRLAGARWADLFDEVAPEGEGAARRVGAAFEKRLARAAELPAARRLAPLVRALEREAEAGPVADVFELALLRLLADPESDGEAVLASFGNGAAVLADEVRAVAERRGELRTRDPEAALRWAMGEAMRTLRGRVGPRALRSALSDALQRVPAP